MGTNMTLSDFHTFYLGSFVVGNVNIDAAAGVCAVLSGVVSSHVVKKVLVAVGVLKTTQISVDRSAK